MALKEVLIASHDSISGYTLEGDIIDIRDPIGMIGKKERMNYFIVLMDEADLPSVEDLHDNSDNPRMGMKHHYNIPLSSIPGMNLTRARALDDPFQPLGKLDAELGKVTEIPSIRVPINRKS